MTSLICKSLFNVVYPYFVQLKFVRHIVLAQSCICVISRHEYKESAIFLIYLTRLIKSDEIWYLFI